MTLKVKIWTTKKMEDAAHVQSTLLSLCFLPPALGPGRGFVSYLFSPTLTDEQTSRSRAQEGLSDSAFRVGRIFSLTD
jgi:hypothetical protein